MKFSLAGSTAAFVLGLSAISPAQTPDHNEEGAVFVMNNSAFRNEVLVYHRSANGSLQVAQHYATGGRGSGGTTDPLGSQGSLTLSDDHAYLFAVNAGSGDVSVFRVLGSGLELTDVVATEGAAPNAVAQHGDLVYVINSAGTSSVVGFRLQDDGKLRRIHKSLAYLSTGAAGAASLSFSPDGGVLLVSEKSTNNIDAFAVQADGTLSAIVVNHDASPGTFAVEFAPDGAALAVETGPAGGANASTISSFLVQTNKTLLPLSSGVPTLAAATCWLAITPDGHFVYTSNAGSGTISGFSIGSNGLLTALPGTVVATNAAGSTNLDIAISADGKFLYTLDSGSGAISEFGIRQNGALVSIGLITGLPANEGLNGIAAL